MFDSRYNQTEFEMSWKRKFEGAELEDENRDPKRDWNQSNIIQLGIHDASAPRSVIFFQVPY